ncbi:hypothetical protein HMPREF1870_01255 [Bacteroidales bacterium KA00344]|nr:hypothetical protein HMPREF1870_01255 [Bacteroidales bacterium KA00344]
MKYCCGFPDFLSCVKSGKPSLFHEKDCRRKLIIYRDVAKEEIENQKQNRLILIYLDRTPV